MASLTTTCAPDRQVGFDDDPARVVGRGVQYGRDLPPEARREDARKHSTVCDEIVSSRCGPDDTHALVDVDDARLS